MNSRNPPRASIDASLVSAWIKVVENINDGLIFSAKNLGDWPVIYLNYEALRMFGYVREEVVNRSIPNLLPDFLLASDGAYGDIGATGRTATALRRGGGTFQVHVQLVSSFSHCALSAVILRVRDTKTPSPSLHDRTDREQQMSEAQPARVMDALCDLRRSLRQLNSVTMTLEHPFKKIDLFNSMASRDADLRIMNQMFGVLIEDIRVERCIAAASRISSADPPIRVLHIEDDFSVARAMARVLRLKGYEVFGAATRDEVMGYFNLPGWRPDLILADFHLAGGCTSEAIIAEVASRLGSRPPTIVLTGTRDPRADHAARGFADRILIKPVDIEILLNEFALALNRGS